VPAVDWAFWMNDENMAKAPAGFIKLSFGYARKIFSDIKSQVTRFDWGREVAPGIIAVETAGHTPGHTSFVIQSGSGKLFVQADVSNVPDLFVRNPEWQLSFDTDPERAVATRRRIYDMAVAERLLVTGYHFPFPGFGTIEKAGAGYRVIPAT
jgi:glyoxylase-like metal-dependent hydrolase (beta-lactamase superfamily II)